MNSTKPCSPIIGLLLPCLLILTLSARLLQAEDVIVTSCVGSTLNSPASAAYDFDSFHYYPTVSSAVPSGADRTEIIYGIGTNGVWAITPALGASTGVYRVYVSKAATTTCSTNLVVKLVASSGCTLADTNSNPQTQVYTTAFQKDALPNEWIPVAIINNSSASPTITFSYASGSSNRWYMDEVRFENIATGAATPARITKIVPGTSLTIEGTGPVSRPFALRSSTNAALPLDQWTREQTNTGGTSPFTFTLPQQSGKAKFFRVETQ